MATIGSLSREMDALRIEVEQLEKKMRYVAALIERIAKLERQVLMLEEPDKRVETNAQKHKKARKADESVQLDGMEKKDA